jgi:hypothetical protein
MQKIMIYFMLLAMPVTSFCQKTNDPVPVIKTDYLAKSKSQKTAAWVLLGGGTVLIGTGFLIGDSKNSSFDDAATGAVLGGIGVLSAIGSIPLFIASGKNKRKAMNMTTSIKMEQATMIQNLSFVQRSYPAIALKINL